MMYCTEFCKFNNCGRCTRGTCFNTYEDEEDEEIQVQIIIEEEHVIYGC